jgi:hypothetical protein
LRLRLLVQSLAPTKPPRAGVDHPPERRRGVKIQAKAVYRDAMRLSHSHLVRATGRRWVSLMLLVHMPWAWRMWAWPLLTALAPSERSHHEHLQRRKKVTDRAQQMLLVVRH